MIEWDQWFDDILREHLPDLAQDEAIAPDLPLALYGLASFGYVLLADALAEHSPFPERLLVGSTFRTAASLWSAVNSAAAEQDDAVRPARHALIGRFLDSVRRNPNSIAVAAQDGVLRYAELDALAGAWANTVRSLVLGVPQRIAVLTKPGIARYAAYLAAMYAGATVVPLNLDDPPARNAAIAQLANVDVLLHSSASGDGDFAAQVEEILAVNPTVDAHDIDALPTTGYLCVASPADEAGVYLVFTSGSTGVPKGVYINNRHLDVYLDAMLTHYRLGPTDVSGNAHDLGFDLSVVEVWLAWANSACVRAVSRLETMNLSATVARYGLTVVTLTPSLVDLIVAKGQLAANSMPGVRYLTFSGERLASRTARSVHAAAPNAAIDNLYGPTETTVNCAFHRWDPSDTENDSVPIGKPHPQVQFLLLDEDGRRADTEGELCIGGPTVFGGYLNKTENVSRFVTLDGRSWYRSGDRVRRLPDGTYVCLGRVDDQLKAHGYRMEPGEIEAALRTATGNLPSAAVQVRTESGPVIVAFVATGGPLDERSVQSELARVLPLHMVPRHVYPIARLPINRNGKLDRAVLRQVAEGAAATARKPVTVGGDRGDHD